MLICGNKVDRENERKVSREEAEEFCRKYQVPYLETSAKEDINVENVSSCLYNDKSIYKDASYFSENRIPSYAFGERVGRFEPLKSGFFLQYSDQNNVC